VIKDMELNELSIRDSFTENEVIHLDREFFPQPWSEDDWESVFSNDLNKIYYMKKQEIGSCGFALFSLDEYMGQAHLLKVIIDPKFRKIGLGEQLLTFAFHKLKREKFNNCFLEVSTRNEGAMRLYESLNFKILNTKKKFYSNGDDAYAMQFIFE
jgi:ribosomal-protein-alanine acetyltransferase